MKALDMGVMYVVTLDEVKVCLVGPHPMCGSWYFPMFLLRDGSLTEMYMASLMVLVVPCASLLMMVKQSTLVGCPIAWL